MTYLNGFQRFDITVTTARWGTFTQPVWARSRAAAQAFADRKWRGQ